jgi:predicted phosphatase
MKIIKSNNITCFDIDNTLLIWDKHYKEKREGAIELNYGDEKIYLKPHSMHITFLKHAYKRGDTVILWSKNGYQHAQQVAKKLKLEKYIHFCMSKPTRHVDDKSDISSICGDRVWIEE